ncbi:neuronal acetylcholine receptor subunit alpha-10-like isoform X2 [Ruditapes philippinarum]|uniref:neuronal acetylcholine receptor subunit alpha-10-like isoform X2 n=1 Tax=Ruditapes philippinarum TaxID=129788 RepID=UPI00295C3625|nr:neuronal acetylcholine receptor subunit alpha-10-like isoform X2 [Ruditapes philippinarum]
MDVNQCQLSWQQLVLATVILTYNVINVTCVSQQVITKTLHDYLLTDYDSNLLPVCATGDNVTLDMDLALRQIMDLNEREQILTTNIWLRLKWNDCRLQWDPNSYSNISSIMFTYPDVWLPDITLYDSAADEVMFPGVESFRAYVSPTGMVSYNFPTVAKSICRVNVKYFPFDTQECALQFGSWSHHGNEIDIVNRNANGDLDNYIDNAEWTVQTIPVERHVLYYNCCPEPYPDVTFYIVMKRRPAFYLLTMIFPCILTSCVAAMGFLLPTESGEKVSLEITVLLSLAVFLLLVSESLPPSSDNFPIIGSYFASSMVLVSLSLLQTVLVINVFYRGTNGRKVPTWARKLCYQYLARFLCIKSNKVETVNDDEELKVRSSKLDPSFEHYESNTDTDTRMRENCEKMADSPNNSHSHNQTMKRNNVLPNFVIRDPTIDALKEQTQCIRNIEEHFIDQKKEDDINSEWRDLSNILDRVFLIMYLLVTIITTLSLILQCL